MLETATLPSGRQRNYEYDRVLMTRMTGKKGDVLLRNSYDSRSSDAATFGNGATYSYDYDWDPNGNYADYVVVTFPNQTMRVARVEGAVLLTLPKAAR